MSFGSSLGSIVSSGMPRSARAYLTPLDVDDTILLNDMRAFQYFPESIQDQKTTNWQPKEIPGLSHPLYQWTAGGAREISFTAIFTRDHAPTDEEMAARGITGQYSARATSMGLKNLGLDSRNVDISAAIAWLRSFKYPEYQVTAGGTLQAGSRPFPPRKVLLGLPGMRINHGNPALPADEILTIMLQCETVYESFFNDGTLRIARVQLAFAETIQYNGTVVPQRASYLRDAAQSYTLTDIGVPKGTYNYQSNNFNVKNK